jgi:hypothetical protein
MAKITKRDNSSSSTVGGVSPSTTLNPSSSQQVIQGALDMLLFLGVQWLQRKISKSLVKLDKMEDKSV